MSQVKNFPVEAQVLGDNDFLGVDVNTTGSAYQTQKFKGAKIGKRGNLVYADAVNGSDTTGVRGRADCPFLTLTAAKNASQAQDTIIVLPGTYNEKDLLAGIVAVNWYFYPKATVLYTGGGDGAIFDDNGAPLIVRIYGYGEFYRQGTGANRTIFRLTAATFLFTTFQEAGGLDGFATVADPGATFNVEAIRDIGALNVSNGTVYVSTPLAAAITVSGGTVKINCGAVFGAVTNSGGQLYLFVAQNAQDITATSNSVVTVIDCASAGNITLAKDSALNISGNINSLAVTGGTCDVNCFDIVANVTVVGTATLNLSCNNLFGTLTADGNTGLATAKVFGNFVNRIVNNGGQTVLIVEIDSASSVYIVAAGGYTLIRNARITSASQPGGIGIVAPVEVAGGGIIRLQNCVLISSGTPAFTVHGITGTEVVKFYGGTVGTHTTSNITVAVGALVVSTNVD